MVDSISLARARRVALAAQGFGSRAGRPAGAVTPRGLDSVIRRLGLLQLDSVNVFARSHYMPLFSRLGAYDRAELDRMLFARRSRFTEYWAHEASVVYRDDWPLWRWRMAERRQKAESDPDHWMHANRAMLDWLRRELATTGPVPAGAIEHDAGRRKGSWWEWSDVKRGLELLFAWGEVVAAGRRGFERVYGLAEHVLPAEVVERRVERADAIRSLVSTAVRAVGVGTIADIADYHRLRTADAAAAITDLVDVGEALPVAVEGWDRPAFMHSAAVAPRRIDVATLLSPFDPVVWFRPRAERLFDFHYRIEIYTPAPKRVFGYYSLPVLVDDRIVGRVDLKSDRQASTLRVQSAWREEGVADDVADRIRPVLDAARAWQCLDRIEVTGRGNLPL